MANRDHAEAVEKFADHLLNVTLRPPRRMAEAQREEHAGDLRVALRNGVPRLEGDELDAFLEALRLALKSKSAAMEWPTLLEMQEAIEELRSSYRAPAGDDLPHGAEHPGRDWFVERARSWIFDFGSWPTWLGKYEGYVISQLNGEMGAEELRRLGAPRQRGRS